MAKVEEIPNEKALFEEYKCLRPCRFMEYKVDSSKAVCAVYEMMKKHFLHNTSNWGEEIFMP